MHLLRFVIALANSSYFVEWIPNNAAAAPPPSEGEWPWQGGWSN